MTILTVGLPVYNAMPFLPLAVESILEQTYKGFELLIINDGSNDGSAEYLATIKDKRVKVLHQENRGLGFTLNRIIEMCQTKYIARMDADDVALAERLEKQLAFMETHPEVVMLGTQLSFLCNGRVVPHAGAPLDHASIVRRLMKSAAGVAHPTLMCRTSSMKRIGGYRIRGAGEELDFCLRMCEVGRVANLPEILFHYRLHESSIVMTRWTEMRRAYSYAIHCAKRRRLHQAEPDFKDFCTKWARCSLFRRLAIVISAWGVIHYRKGLLNVAERQRLRAIYHFFMAALAMPQTALRRLGTTAVCALKKTK